MSDLQAFSSAVKQWESLHFNIYFGGTTVASSEGKALDLSSLGHFF